MQTLSLKNLIGIAITTFVYCGTALGHPNQWSGVPGIKRIGTFKDGQDSRESWQPQKFEDLNKSSQGKNTGIPNLQQQDEMNIPSPQGEELEDPMSSQSSTPTQAGSMPIIITPRAEIVTWHQDVDDDSRPPEKAEDPDDPTSKGDRKGGRHKGMKLYRNIPLQMIPIIRMNR